MNVLTERTALILPVLNAEPWLDRFFTALELQTVRPSRVLVIDSGSRDRSVAIARARGAEVRGLDGRRFDHGGTRRWAASLCSGEEFLVFMTQDALLADRDSLAELLAPLHADRRVGAVWGRQLPHADAGLLARHARAFSYPETSRETTLEDAARLGLKAAFLSDAFTAYRSQALKEAGGFPDRAICSEDMYVGARMLITGWALAYAATSTISHSHDYSICEEFRRYFDVGVFHGANPWIQERFGPARDEGRRFVLSELSFLRQHQVSAIPGALLRTCLKYAGFQLGRRFFLLPAGLTRSLSRNPAYWQA